MGRYRVAMEGRGPMAKETCTLFHVNVIAASCMIVQMCGIRLQSIFILSDRRILLAISAELMSLEHMSLTAATGTNTYLTVLMEVHQLDEHLSRRYSMIG